MLREEIHLRLELNRIRLDSSLVDHNVLIEMTVSVGNKDESE